MTSWTKKFNPKSQAHVEWLKTLSNVLDTTKMSNPLEMEKAMRKMDLKKLLTSNPMGVPVSDRDLMEFPMIHFGLAMVYTNAVLNSDAWLPPKNSD